jgi:UDP-glucose 4-epimerase
LRSGVLDDMRVVIFGATGNIGSSLVNALRAEPSVTEVTGVARRIPVGLRDTKMKWLSADVSHDDLNPLVAGADAVIHLAWSIQPSRRPDDLYRTNVLGSTRVLEAVQAAGTPVLIAASSVGAYSPGPKDDRVDETWPTEGIPTSFYARHKAALEHALDDLEAEATGTRIVRVRPGLVFQRDAATEIRRLFTGPFLPTPLLRRRFAKLVPDVAGLRFQAIHADDVARVYKAALLDNSFHGAVNAAAEPIIDMQLVADHLEARLVRVPRRLARLAVDSTWRARLQPTPEGWLDMALAVPIMATRRMHEELKVTPVTSAFDALCEVVEGIREGSDAHLPPLTRRKSGPFRLREVAALVGGRELL